MLGLWDADNTSGVIDTKEFGPVQCGCPLDYKIPSPNNTFGLAEIVALGTEASRGQGLDRPQAGIGDIVGIDLGQVGHVVAHGGKEKYFVPWIKFVCKFRRGERLPMPLMNYVMTEQDDAAMNCLMFKGNLITALPSALSGGMATNSRVKTGVKICAEKVLSIGQGRFVNKVWTEAQCKQGDAVIFMPSSATLNFKPKAGGRLRFTPWSECEAVLEAGYADPR